MAALALGLDTLPVIVLAADELGHVVLANDRWVFLTGLSVKASLAEGWLAAVHHDDRAALAERWRDPSSAGHAWRFEARLLMREGEPHWFEVRVEPVFRAGRLAGLMSVWVDVDARKRLEVGLREAEGAWREMINSIAQLAWVAEPDGSIFWYNQRWFEYTGSTPEEMHGWGWQSVHDPREVSSVLEAWREAIASGAPIELTFPLRGVDGVYRPFLTRAIPLKDESGRVLRWFGTNTEVTALDGLQRDRERLLANLSVERRRLSDAVRHAPAMVALVRASDGVILLANPTMEHFFDRPLVGRQVREAFADLLEEPLFVILARVLETGRREEAREARTRVPRRAGALERYLDVAFQPIEASGGHPDTVLVFAIDSTRGVRARREVERLNERLESRVLERTSELAARNRTLEAFAILMRDLAVETSPERIAGRALEVIGTLMPLAASGVFLPDGEVWRAAATLGEISGPHLRAALQAGLRLAETPVMTHVLAGGAPNYQDKFTPFHAEHATLELNGASACLPLTTSGRPSGVLLVVQAERREWTPADRAALETSAVSLGQAMERAEATGALALARSRSDALARLADELQAAGSLAEAGGITFERMSALLAVRRLVVLRLDGENLRLQGAWGDVNLELQAALRRGLPLSGPSVSSAAARAGVTRCSNDVTHDPSGAPVTPLGHALSDQVEASSELAVAAEPFPLHGVTHVLTCVRSTASGPWQPGELELFQRAALTFSIALNRVYAEERNRAQRDELEARNAEQETFVYTVSHDLRAPLLAIAGMSALLAEAVTANDAEEASFLLGRVTANVEKMQQLLTDLLNLSRAGRSMDEPELLDLNESLGVVINDLHGLTAARDASIEVPGPLPTVRYSRSDAYQVLTNLISNAVKYGGREGEPPRVTISAGPSSAGDPLVTLQIDDNGPGVPERYRERIFGLFQRLSQEGEGTGVGLAIVRRTVERNGGQVSVHDAPGGGARITVTLPSGE